MPQNLFNQLSTFWYQYLNKSTTSTPQISTPNPSANAPPSSSSKHVIEMDNDEQIHKKVWEMDQFQDVDN